MSKPFKQLRAQFFVRPDGVVFRKAKPVSPRLRDQILARDKGRCRLCSLPVTRFRPARQSMVDPTTVGHVDHILARSRGGQNDPKNLRLLCEHCNLSKGAR